MSCIVAMLTSKHKVTRDLVHLWRHVYLSTNAPITNLFYAILLSNSLVSRRLLSWLLDIWICYTGTGPKCAKMGLLIDNWNKSAPK